MSGRHVPRWWPEGARGMSGGAFAAMIAFLTLSGFVLFFVSGDVSQHIAALTHDVLGLGIVVFAIQHWFTSPAPGR